MKKYSKFIPLLCGILILFTFLMADTFIVKVRTTNLRIEPKFYAKTLVFLQNGEKLEKIGARDGWLKVKTTKGIEGWIHLSAVEEKKFSLTAINQPLKTQATAGEVALAAKAFDKNVEEAYMKKHPQISFAQVDKMLKIKISPAQMKIFLKRGKLGEFGREK